MLAIYLFTHIPTVSSVISPPNLYKYWWLRSPNTDVFYHAYLVFPSGDVSYLIVYDVYNSYGKDEAALMHQILINIGG